MIIDGCERHITYLRVSLTDKCNLRCKYCVPPEGVKMLDHADILTHEEMLRIIVSLCRSASRRFASREENRL